MELQKSENGVEWTEEHIRRIGDGLLMDTRMMVDEEGIMKQAAMAEPI